MFSINNSTTSLLKIFFLCPVPDDQKPITEYIELKQNFFFNWIVFKSKKWNLFFSNSEYDKNQLNAFNEIKLDTIRLEKLGFFLLTISILNLWTNFSSFFSFFCFCSFLLLFQPFFLLKKINMNFQNSRLIYEEGSWYQGKIWEKPFLVMKNEKLIRIQKIEPSLQNIKKTFFLLFLFFIPFFLIHLFLN